MENNASALQGVVGGGDFKVNAPWGAGSANASPEIGDASSAVPTPRPKLKMPLSTAGWWGDPAAGPGSPAAPPVRQLAPRQRAQEAEAEPEAEAEAGAEAEAVAEAEAEADAEALAEAEAEAEAR